MVTGPIVLIMIQTEFQETSDTLNNTVSMSGSRLQNHICQLPNPQFPDRDFTAKNIRGFTSNTKAPNSSDRYPETPKRAH